MTDQEFLNERMSMSVDEYLVFERLLCECDPDGGTCVCGWDDLVGWREDVAA